ncbi:ABC transporter substrate-binding protein [Roseiarcaceae bacterium H3SJ34-1]|uniref:ABC transporter substrate-binding protein n=1 Tax=Terripilifer ovatus TaxID=3032367 RepID=UPI003AB95D31|nr:ABC transporter substrate-binding protein [Roseiarcaceae bacterium H3SJ34-1]
MRNLAVSPVRLALAAGFAVLAAAPALAQTQALAKVKVGNVNTVSDISIYIADKKGYFKAEGLDIEFIGFQSAARMIAPLGTGELDVGGGTVGAGLYNAYSRKIGIAIVADKGSSKPGYNFSQLMVRKDLVDSGRYKTFADLKGLKIATVAKGTGNAATLNFALKLGGLTFKDADIVELGFPQHVPAYANKAIDASITNEPTLTLIERRGLAVRVDKKEQVYPDHQTAVLLYSDKFRKERAGDALKFMRAYIRGARDYNDSLKDGHIAGPNADEVIATLVQYTEVKDPALHRDTTPNACDPNGNINIASLEDDLNFFKADGLIEDKNIKATDVIDLSFAQKVQAELGPYVKK